MPAARPLPSWAVEPLDMDGAARVLGISRRTLTDKLADGLYEPRGNRKVFYPEHIARLREVLSCSRSSNEVTPGMPMEPLPESAFEKALALATKGKPKSSARNSMNDSGNVTPLVRPPSAPSRKPQ